MRAKSRASTIKKSNPSVPAEKDLPVKEGSTLEAPSQCSDVQSSAKPEGELPELPKVEVVDVFASTSGLEFRNSASTSTTADENQTSKDGDNSSDGDQDMSCKDLSEPEAQESGAEDDSDEDVTDDEQTSPKKSKKSGLNNCMVYGDTCKLCENAESMKREQDNSYFQVCGAVKLEPTSLKVYRSVISLSEHLQCHHLQPKEDSNSQHPFLQCPHCPKRYAMHGTLKSCYNYTLFHIYRKHDRRVLPRNFSIHSCEICSFQTLRRRDLKRHMMVMHSDKSNAKERRQPCTECGKYILKTSMKLHMATAHGSQDISPQIKARTELHKCDICDKMFRGLPGLERHKNCVHNKVREQLCHLCSQAFFAKRELELHMFATHKINISKSKVLKCEVEGCKYETLARRHLMVHGAVHKTTKDFVCDSCGKTFKNQPALRQHIRIKHMLDQEYKCPKCFFKSHAKQYVTRHMVIHSDTKNHKCQHEGCSYETHFIENLNKHKKKHLKEGK